MRVTIIPGEIRRSSTPFGIGKRSQRYSIPLRADQSGDPTEFQRGDEKFEIFGSGVLSLVFVAAFAPEAGETAAELSGRFPGGTLASALAAPVDLADGGKDLYIQRDKFHDQFAADVSEADARRMAADQRPVTVAALMNRAGLEDYSVVVCLRGQG